MRRRGFPPSKTVRKWIKGLLQRYPRMPVTEMFVVLRSCQKTFVNGKTIAFDHLRAISSITAFPLFVQKSAVYCLQCVKH